MKRRTAVLAGVAGVALAAGGGSSIWRSGRQVEEGVRSGGDIWSRSVESIDGAPLHLVQLRGRPLLLNFWATWCAPCVTEMPLLDAFSRQHAASWRVLALAIDKPEPVRRFLEEQKLSLPVAFADTIGIDLSRSLGNTVGALPFSAVFASDGSKAAIHLGALQSLLLQSWAETVR